MLVLKENGNLPKLVRGRRREFDDRTHWGCGCFCASAISFARIGMPGNTLVASLLAQYWNASASRWRRNCAMNCGICAVLVAASGGAMDLTSITNAPSRVGINGLKWPGAT